MKKKVYDRNVMNKYGTYYLLGVIAFDLIDYIYIYVHVYVLSYTFVLYLKICNFEMVLTYLKLR